MCIFIEELDVSCQKIRLFYDQKIYKNKIILNPVNKPGDDTYDMLSHVSVYQYTCIMSQIFIDNTHPYCLLDF